MGRQAGGGGGVFAILEEMFDGDLHAKRVLSLANATLGVMVSASLAVSVIGQSLAQARGPLTRHAVKQVDRLLSNQGIDVWEIMSLWVPEVIGSAKSITVAQARHDLLAEHDQTWINPSFISPLTGVVVRLMREAGRAASAEPIDDARRFSGALRLFWVTT